jgi:glucokinase
MKVLAADIGGTKSLLQVTDWSGDRPQVLVERRYLSGAYAHFEPLLQEFLEGAGEIADGLAGVCFAVAGPVAGRTVDATNLPWSLDAERLQAGFNLPRVTLINDFQAIGYGIECLKPEDFLVLQPGVPEANAPRAIIGAGTGLGQAILVWQEREGFYQVLPTEGGHVDFAPRGELQIELLRYLSRSLEHVSYERLLSGEGLVALYRFLKETSGIAEDTALVKAMREGDAAAAISAFALEQRERLSSQALDLFVQIYGAQAGNLALSCLPRGGLFVSGGIAPKIFARLQYGGFMDAFLSKGRLSNLLQRIPVKVILETKVGVWGAAFLAAQVAKEKL